jgi:Flp pilus assembly protein TadD/TolB-like protein
LKSHRLLTLFALLFVLAAIAAGQPAPGTQTVLVLPFDNSTHQPGLGWISEAFPEVLGQRLDTQSLFLISRDDRQYAFDRMGIPVNLHASRATLYRIAAQLDADYIILGSYSYDGQTFTARAQVLDMKALRLSPDQVESGPLNSLIAIQTALAWDVLRQLRPVFSEPREAFLQRAPAIRLDAFEDFIRGVLASGSPDKIRYLKAAVAINPQYAQSILLLAKTYFAAREYEQAALWFAKLPADDPAAAEANFLLGLCQYHLGHFDKAAEAFKATAQRIPLTEVLNNIGAAETRRGHQRDAADYFEKAVAADPSDPDYRFNLAVALYRKGDLTAAQRQLRETLSRRPNDNEARQLQESLTASLAAPSAASSATPPATPTVRPAPTSAAPPVLPAAHLAPPTFPLPRIKRNYDESSYRQLAVELQNAIEASIGKAKPADRAALHIERAREFLANGTPGEAESQFREALSHEPTNPGALAGLAHALLLQNKFSEARQTANVSIAWQPSAEAYLVVARTDLHDNNLAAASQKLQKALALEPASADAKALEQEIQTQTTQSEPAR